MNLENIKKHSGMETAVLALFWDWLARRLRQADSGP